MDNNKEVEKAETQSGVELTKHTEDKGKPLKDFNFKMACVTIPTSGQHTFPWLTCGFGDWGRSTVKSQKIQGWKWEKELRSHSIHQCKQ